MKISILIFLATLAFSVSANESSLAPEVSIRPVPRPVIIRPQMRSISNADGSQTLINPEIVHQGKSYKVDSGSKPQALCRALGFEKQLEFTKLKESSELNDVILLEGDWTVYRSRSVSEVTCLNESERKRVIHVEGLFTQADGIVRVEEPALEHGGEKLAISAQSYPSDLCSLFGLKDVEASTIFSRGFPGSEALSIGLNGVIQDQFYDEEVGAIVCRERKDADQVSNLKPETIIHYQVGDFRPSFFLSRGIKLIEAE